MEIFRATYQDEGGIRRWRQLSLEDEVSGDPLVEEAWLELSGEGVSDLKVRILLGKLLEFLQTEDVVIGFVRVEHAQGRRFLCQRARLDYLQARRDPSSTSQKAYIQLFPRNFLLLPLKDTAPFVPKISNGSLHF